MNVRLVLTLSLFFTFFSQALSQAPYVQQYEITNLSLVPGELRVSAGYSTIVEFPSTVDLIVTGAPDMLTIDDLGTRIVLTTNVIAGSTDLFLEVNGRSIMFEVFVDTNEQMIRRYLVANEHKRAYSPPQAVLPSVGTPPPTAPGNPVAVGDGSGGDLTLTPSGFSADGSYTFFFQYRNATGQRVALDPTRLVLNQSGTSKRTDVRKEPLRNLVSPGETQNGLVTVEGVTPGAPLEITWQVVLLSGEGGAEATLGGQIDAP